MTSSTNKIGPEIDEYSANRISLPSKPFPNSPGQAATTSVGTMKMDLTKAVPVVPRSAADETNLVRLLKENVTLHLEQEAHRRKLQELELQEKAIHDNAEAQRQKIRQEAEAQRAAIRAESKRQAVIEMLTLIFDANKPLFENISVQDSEKFDFDSEKEIFVVTESAMTEVVLKYMRANKVLTSVDLTVCSQLPERTVIKLLEQGPTTGLKQIILPRPLTTLEKQAETIAKRTIKDLKITVQS